MPICNGVLEEARRLIEVGASKGLTMRLLGGLAVAIHSPSAAHRALARSYPDIDLVVPARSQEAVEQILTAEGYEANMRFNTLSEGRQLYYDRERGRQVDVFIGGFQMCHKLPVADRLHLEPLTLPLAELFLTKAQIVSLNRKDVLDLVALLLDHPPGHGDEETINQDLIAGLCAHDWGLYTTLTMYLQKVGSAWPRCWRRWTAHRRAWRGRCARAWAHASAGTMRSKRSNVSKGAMYDD